MVKRSITKNIYNYKIHKSNSLNITTICNITKIVVKENSKRQTTEKSKKSDIFNRYKKWINRELNTIKD